MKQISSERLPYLQVHRGRRLFLLQGTGSAAGMMAPKLSTRLFTVGAAVAGGVAMPGTARAELATFAVAATSVIIGFIVRHNQGDGGLSSMLTASLEYHRAALVGLSHVLTGMAELRGTLNELSSQVSTVPQLTIEALVQANLRTEVGVYANVMESHASKGYQVWRVLQQKELEEVWRGLGRTIASVESSPFTHPVTVTALLGAHNAYLAAGSALLFDKADQKVAATRCLRLYKQLMDASVPGSTRARLDSLLASRATVTSELQKLGFVPSTGKPAAGQTVALGGTSIQDYSPPERQPSLCRPLSRLHVDFGETCLEQWGPGRIGSLEHFQHEVLVAGTEVVTPPAQVDQARRLVLYAVGAELTTRSVASPFAGGTSQRYVAMTSDVRRRLARQEQHLAPAQARRTNLAALLDKHNQLSTEILLYELALDGVMLNAGGIRQRFLENAG